MLGERQWVKSSAISKAARLDKIPLCPSTFFTMILFVVYLYLIYEVINGAFRRPISSPTLKIEQKYRNDKAA
jgi:hypothetical protein